MLLKVKDLTVRFGGLTAVSGLNLHVNAGEVLSVIGPNGAGKTTVFNAITGLTQPSEGEITCEGALLTRRMTKRTLAAFGAIGGTTGLLTTLLLNIEKVWQAAILDHYSYRQPFPWAAAAASFRDVLILTLLSEGGGVFLGATALGTLGAVSVWRRFRRTPDVVARFGILRTFQNIRLFRRMSVLENVLLGMESTLRSGFWSGAVRNRRYREEEERARTKARELLTFVGLEEVEGVRAESLSYGSQRRLEIARALASDPKLLLLDEPAAGMNPKEAGTLAELIQRIRERGTSVLLIEHHMNVVMNISDRIVVRDYGNKIAEGTPQEIRANPRVIEAYLGKSE